MIRIKHLNSVMTGIFLILVSVLAFYLASPLRSTTDVGLGPGYVPKVFASLQLGLGALMIFNGFYQEGEDHEPWHLRPLMLVLASVVFFAVSIERLGLALSVTGLVLIACAANRGTTLKEAVILAVATAAGTSFLFVKLLGLSMAVWPPLLRGS